MEVFKYVVIFWGIIPVCFSGLNDVLPDKACPGTNNGFSFSTRHYQRLRRQFRGCSHVTGNLEITNLDDPDMTYDMSFLKDIRYVGGYVLIGLNTELRVLPLPSLQIIRGNQTIRISGNDYALAVVLNYRRNDLKHSMTELQLPALKEISNGGVLFSQNPRLCYVDTIDWQAITGRGRQSITLSSTAPQPPFSRTCGGCPLSCEINGILRCWSNSSSMCQRVLPDACHPACPYRCYGPGIKGCCHDNCASGCWGPSDTECMMCKDYRLWNQCRGTCPPIYRNINQICYKPYV